MVDNFTIMVGTVGQGMNVSGDSGETWTKIRQPIPSESNIRALRTYPDNPHRILAGSDGLGLFRSEDNGVNWESVDSPIGDLQVWSVAVDPANTDTIFAGTRPEGFRSRDGGKTWDKLDMGVNLDCPIGTPRTTNVIVDPRDSNTIWAGIEVDGDEAIGEQIVAVPVSTVVVVGRHLGREIRDPELEVGADLPPHSCVAGIAPRFIEPRVVAELVGAGNGVKNPLALTGPRVVAADIPLLSQHIEHPSTDVGRRCHHLGPATHLRIADAGQHVAQRIVDCHVLYPPTSST